jgi:hypothetical protein
MKRIIVAAWMCAAIGIRPAWAQDTGDTGTATDPDLPVLSKDDLDNDGYSPFQGDCNDDDRTIFPGTEEICFDRIDNNCNGLFDEACDGRAQSATLRGGGGCTGGTGVGNTAFVLLPLLFLFRRRA